MKTIGLIGGMSWESTVSYYRIINTIVKEKLGGFHSAKCLLYSLDFHEIEECQSNNDWDKAALILGEAAVSLEKAGADFIVICTNTMHKSADSIREKINIPIMHIADATADELLNNNIKRVALLGTKFTMEESFYKDILTARDIEVIIPDEAKRAFINDVIYNELCLGNINEKSKQKFLEIIEKLARDGAQGVILGCTEIGLLVEQSDTKIPLFDTTLIHASKAALSAI